MSPNQAASPTVERSVAWDKRGKWGSELTDVRLARDSLTASGVGIGWDPLAYVLTYTLETGPRWVTRRLVAETRGDGWRRRLDLRRSESGRWTLDSDLDGEADLQPPGGEVAAFSEALDCDLGLSPLTNTMPVLRHDLLRQNSTFEFLMAWVSVPALGVVASPQRYAGIGRTSSRPRRIQYSSLQRDFVSNLSFDDNGLVIDYPQLARRVPPTESGQKRQG